MHRTLNNTRRRVVYVVNAGQSSQEKRLEMATEALTDDQRSLLLRWFDGELDNRAEVDRVEQLVETSGRARAFVETLEELQSSTVAAFDAALPADDELPGAPQVVERAIDADPLEESPLDELAPLLERYHDDEITDPARAAVERLVDRRDDVAAYLQHLETLGDATRAARDAALEEVELDGLRDDIDRDVAYTDHPDDPPAYDPNRDEPLLHRFVDGELPESKRDLVETWLEDDPDAARTVETLEDLGGAAEAAHQQATERVDFGSLRSDIDDRISELDSDADDHTDDESADVVSLDSSRSDGGRTGDSQTADETHNDSDRPQTTGWFSGYRQGLVGAAAAALLVAAAGVVFGTNLFENERVVVKEKTVVIVDSVQYDKGSSVVVDSPMKKVSADNQTDSTASDDSSSDNSGEEQPTVIWLLDSDKQQNPDGAEETSPSGPPNDSENSRDAGSPDDNASPDAGEHRGQPI
jgi:anti-sigma factor RsiW